MWPMASLKSKIYAGFGITSVLLLVNGVLGYTGIVKTQESSKSIRDIHKASSSVQIIDRDVQELRLSVRRFIQDGHDSQRQKVLELISSLEEDIEAAKSHNLDPDSQEAFLLVSEHLRGYAEQFDVVMEERKLRASLVQNELPRLGQSIDEMFQSVTQELSDTSQKVKFIEAQQRFASSQKQLLRYFTNPDSTLANESVTELEHSMRLLAESLNSQNSTNKADIQELSNKLQDFERMGLRAVQATRGYLFLVNVLMSGEASEVAHYSKSLMRMTNKRRADLSNEVKTATEKTKDTTQLGIILVLLVALVLSSRLAYLIVTPISRLTSTFKLLAEGKTRVTVPETNRADEIGEMAKAAEVFRSQNEQTQTLLNQSRELSYQLVKHSEDLKAINEELDSFAYIASHDLRSPLRGISQLTSCIVEDDDSLKEETSELLSLIQERITKMEDLLENLLEYSRAGRVEIEPELVDVHMLVSDTIELLNNPNKVEFIYSEDLPKFVTSKTPFEQVLQNLITNALKYNDNTDGGRIEISCQTEGNRYLFVVNDNGSGISPRHHERIFKMYQRVGNSQVEGSGMGLAIVKKQVESYGGTITVDSDEGRGAKFSFTWPISLQEEIHTTELREAHV